jgi:carboxypeptidase C (cathepsin A)
MTEASQSLPEAGPVDSLPGYGPVRERQLAGNLPVDASGKVSIYFWFIESRSGPGEDPIVIWLNGGPGASSFIGLFEEGGPYRINKDGGLDDNPGSWNARAAFLMIDQPSGTGLSVCLDPAGQARTEEQASNQLYHGLQHFFGRWPEFRKRDLYIFGESYAGVYVPLLATAILNGNAAGAEKIRLQGIGVGDGWVDPIVQQATYGDYAYSQGLVSLTQKQHVDSLYANCAKAIRESQPVTSRQADKICNWIEEYITKVSGGANVYDVRTLGDYNFDAIGRYLDQPSVRNALHVAPGAAPWAETAKRPAYLLERGEQNSYAWLYPRLFESIRVLIYNGLYDMDCNFMGTDAWIAGQQWSYRNEFLHCPRTPWVVEGQLLGHVRSVERLTQVLISGAGHLVPMDQPAAAFALLNGFVHGDPALK